MPKLPSIVFAALAVAVVSAVFAIWLTGAAAPQKLLDPGTIVRWGSPAVRAIRDWSMASTIGVLVFAGFALEKGKLRKSLNIAAISGALWSIAAIINLVFTYANIAGSPVSTSKNFGDGFFAFVTTISLGQYLAINLGFALVVTLLALTVDKISTTGLTAVLALLALIPIAISGHSAAVQGHDMAVNSLGIHLVAVSVWVGGLVGLATSSERSNLSVAKRYSSLALLAYLMVAISGVAAALIRIDNISSLLTGYGLLILVKSVTLIVLGSLGAIYRLRLLKNTIAPSFIKLIGFELLLMGLAIGFAASLSQSAPPVASKPNTDIPTPAELLTGEKLPSELLPSSWVTAWRIDLIWLVVVVLGTAFYLLGVIRLSKRGDKWPVARTVAWLGGMAMLLYITCGPINVYEKYLFSVHMIGHMMLTMAVPVLLVPGAPVTLLMRAVAKREDESWGVREWVLWAVHTKWAQFVSHPIVAAINFAASLVVFYFTPLFALATREHLFHEWMIVHFLITGYLFVQALVGIDPGPKRFDYPIRLMLLIGTLAFHAFFGLALMQGDALLLADWYGAMGRTWGDTPLADQKTGGAIAWGVGELPAAVLTLVVSVQWSRSDSRVSKRLDRASDRSGNQDIEDYNKMLADLAKREERRQ
ncbi:MAG: cytochrome c oxidase assembly protein [Micrococcales bacterium]